MSLGFIVIRFPSALSSVLVLSSVWISPVEINAAPDLRGPPFLSPSPPPLVRLMRASPPPPRDEPRINIVNLVDATCEQRRLINHRTVINRQSQRRDSKGCAIFFLCSLSLSLCRNIFIFVEELNKRMCIYSYIGKRE